MMRNNTWGVLLAYSSDNIWFGNTIMGQKEAVRIDFSSGNRFFHNNFLNNKWQIDNWLDWTNTWDNGSEGNYWSDYSGSDSKHDGIGDTPYVIGANNIDHYPSMAQYVVPEFPSLLVIPMFMIATLLAIVVCKRRH
jgi:parallel beta-helix repeat protein